MIAVIPSLSLTEAWDLSLKELCWMYDAVILQQWDQTALQCSLLHNIGCLIIATNSKARPKPKSMTDFHPYRESTRKQGLKIDSSNMGTLRSLVSGVLAAKR